MVLKVMRPKRSASPIDDDTLPELVLFREARALKQCKHRWAGSGFSGSDSGFTMPWI